MTMPRIVEHPDRPYVGVLRTITMTTFGEVADRIPELIAWLGRQGVALAGAPFLRYRVIETAADRLEVEAGVPVPRPLDGTLAEEAGFFAAALPAGRYATVTHHGHPDRLAGVIGDLLGWADKEGLTWDLTERDGAERWGCRLELYETDPRVEPDPANWDIRLEFRLA
ncbi:GyrI-like domain-containing protein [Nonomuraea rhodomycinica]|uniref:GyrI-like domain-containing protein n=1 Tax=Nonomuraea rhodomycinica TaxID=1712872 RepID=A0A7Y6IMI4_9ACTN|nr:GyrI-like domain-containing protein [Nonomuraea rhodomycinica]NUW40905.1 GyrI-like domain-containing protein [Nonomuraea rhodomycinica]